MKFCDVKGFLLAVFIIGIGVGIVVAKWLCLGYFSAVVIIGIGVWRLF